MADPAGQYLAATESPAGASKCWGSRLSGSVSAIWLRRLYRGSIETEALAEAYSPAWMVDTRLERLADNGFVAREAGGSSGYRLTEKGRGLMRTFGRLRRLFNHAPRAR